MKILTLTVAVFASCLFMPETAAACSCPAPGDPCMAIRAADAVFVGRAIDVQPASMDSANPRPGTVRLGVAEVLHGTVPNAVVLRNGNGGDCYAMFQRGGDYLIYARYVGGVLEASLCSRTGELAGRKHEVALLREMRRGVPAPRLAGRVVESRLRLDGRRAPDLLPLSGIVVTAQRGTDVRRTVTDADGDFIFPNLAPGDYTVRADLPAGYERVSGQDARETVTCYGYVGIGVSRIPLHGTLAIGDGSSESPSAAIHAFAIDPSLREPSLARSTRTSLGRDGTWSFEGLPPGDYVIGVGVQRHQWDPLRMPFWYPAAMRPQDAEVIRVGDGTAVQLALRHPPAPREVRFAGVLIGPSGDPIEGGVWIRDLEADQVVGNSSTDARGRFEVRGWEGRRYTITAYACQLRVPVMSDAVAVDPNAAGSLRVVLTRACPAPQP